MGPSLNLSFIFHFLFPVSFCYLVGTTGLIGLMDKQVVNRIYLDHFLVVASLETTAKHTT